MDEDARLLRTTFLLGAVIDAGALAPMLHPRLAELLWGFEKSDGRYGFAMRMGASLMAGWTLLLFWAARKPFERRAVAPMTVQVIAGLAAAEALAVKSGDMVLGKALPSWVMQAVLTLLFLTGHARTIVGSARARIE